MVYGENFALARVYSIFLALPLQVSNVLAVKFRFVRIGVRDWFARRL